MSYSVPLLLAFLSFAGICWIIAKKIPILRSLPQTGEFSGYLSGDFFVSLPKKISGVAGKDALIAFFGFLEKRLRQVKIVVLKIDNKIAAMIKKLRDRIVHHETMKENGFASRDDAKSSGFFSGFSAKKESIFGGLSAGGGSASSGKTAKQTEIKKGLDEIQVREEQWIEILSKDPANIDAYKELGKIYLATNRHQEAKETLAFALKLNPQDEEIRRYLRNLP